jgi:hypothetical protein
MMEIKKVDPEEATRIIETREPRGLFYCIDKEFKNIKVYVGIDNTYGDAWTEDFRTLASCKRWLIRG